MVVSSHRLFFLSQAEDLVANFFPKKLLELDGFLKVRSTLSSALLFVFVQPSEKRGDGDRPFPCPSLCVSPHHKETQQRLSCWHALELC